MATQHFEMTAVRFLHLCLALFPRHLPIPGSLGCWISFSLEQDVPTGSPLLRRPVALQAQESRQSDSKTPGEGPVKIFPDCQAETSPLPWALDWSDSLSLISASLAGSPCEFPTEPRL